MNPNSGHATDNLRKRFSKPLAEKSAPTIARLPSTGFLAIPSLSRPSRSAGDARDIYWDAGSDCGRRGAVRLRQNPWRRYADPVAGYRRCRSVFIPPNTLHHLTGTVGRIGFLYVDALSHDLYLLWPRRESNAQRLISRLKRNCRRNGSCLCAEVFSPSQCDQPSDVRLPTTGFA